MSSWARYDASVVIYRSFGKFKWLAIVNPRVVGLNQGRPEQVPLASELLNFENRTIIKGDMA